MDDALVWERPEPPKRATPSPLSRKRIVRAAITLADADSLDAVSLRKVGAVLDAGPMRLYGYVASKEELLDLMVDAVYAEITARGPAVGEWHEAVLDLALRTREAALRHRWFADLLGGRPQLGPGALGCGEAMLRALRRVPGADVDDVNSAAGAVNAYVTGAVRREMGEQRAAAATGLDESQWQAATGPYLTRVLATGHYPTLAEVVHEARHLDPETAFTDGLEYLLAGITARLRP